MEIPELKDEDVRALRASQAHRHPFRAKLSVPGDGGKATDLTVVLGTPSGACTMPADERRSPAWNKLIGTALKQRTEAPGLAQELVADCVLWPGRDVVGQWLERWPGLPQSISDAISTRVAAAPGTVTIPDDDHEPLAAVAALLEKHPRASWLVVRPSTKVEDAFALVVEPPSSAAWKLFQEALGKPKADHWKHVSEMTKATVRGAVRLADGAEVDAIERMKVLVGLPVVLVARLAGLVGSVAEVELGEL